MSHSKQSAWLRLMLAGLCLAAAATGLAVEREDEADGDESDLIQLRWETFEQAHALREAPDSAALRRQAVLELQRERERLDPALRGSGEVWQELGPSSMRMGNWAMGRVSGRLNAITPVPGNDDTVYIGSAAGGVWKTTDAGQHWTAIFDQVGTLPIGAISLDPANANVVWVGTGDKNGGACAGYFGLGVYLSEDAGASWQARNGTAPNGMPLSVVNAVAIQPTDSNVILAGGAGRCDANGSLLDAGVYRSADRGLSWTRVLNSNVEDILFVPGTATVYAGLIGSGVYKSTDGGLNWAPANNGLAISGSRLRLAMAPGNANILYVLAGDDLFRSSDGGANWIRQNSDACENQCFYNQTLAVHPGNPDTVLLGTIRAALSSDAGVSFSPLTQTWGSAQSVHQDTHVVRYSSTNPSRLWIGSDGGIWRSDNGGISFVNMNANLNLTQFYDIAVDPNDPNIVFGGAQDNSSSGRRTSLLWHLTFASGDGFMNAFDENDPSIVFQTSYPSGNLPYIVRSFSGGSPGSFSRMSTTGITPSANFAFRTAMASAGSSLFVASNVMYRASTSGNSWTAISPSFGNSATTTAIVPAMHGSLMPTYVGTSNGRIWASADAGIPAPVFSDVTGNYPGGQVSDLAMDPADAQRVFATRAGFGAARLYRSTTGGNTWTAVGNGLPNVPANTVMIDPLDTQRIFVGTDIGVYQSTDGGDTFQAWSAGLPLGLVVTDLEINTVPHVLTAGTYGRGAWRVVLDGSAGNAPPTADFQMQSDGPEASFSDTSIDVDGSIATWQWDFGDGSPSGNVANPQHTYAQTGFYTVTLTVTDDGGLSASYARVLRINPPTIALENGVALENQGSPQGGQRLYTLVVPVGATTLTFQTSGEVSGQDADLSVELEGQTLCQSAGPSDEEQCTFVLPAPGTYLAIVDAYTTLTNFTILGQYSIPPDLIFENGFD